MHPNWHRRKCRQRDGVQERCDVLMRHNSQGCDSRAHNEQNMLSEVKSYGSYEGPFAVQLVTGGNTGYCRIRVPRSWLWLVAPGQTFLCVFMCLSPLICCTTYLRTYVSMVLETYWEYINPKGCSFQVPYSVLMRNSFRTPLGWGMWSWIIVVSWRLNPQRENCYLG